MCFGSKASDVARLPLGRRAAVRVAASTANLGPGFDAMGMAFDWCDEAEAELIDGPSVVVVSGEGAESVPLDERHLVLRSLREGLAAWRADAGGVRLTTRNAIPHSRGLGSSAAAIVAGLALAWGLARPGVPLERQELFRLSSAAEGHPDNAAAAVFGGGVLAWGSDADVDHVELRLHPDLAAIVFVPAVEVSTALARKALPDVVPRLDAVRQAANAALLVHALTVDPRRLLLGTRDLLHQPYRGALMPASFGLMSRLREAAVPAVISGAGPAVLAIGTRDQLAIGEIDTTGFAVHPVSVGAGVTLL